MPNQLAQQHTSQQDGESFTSYIEDVVYLCKRVLPQMPEADKVKHILKGVDDDALQMLSGRHLRSVDQVDTLCQSFKELRKQRVPTRQHTKKAEPLAGLTPAADPSLLQMKDLVREAVARQLFLLPSTQEPQPQLVLVIRQAIQKQVDETFPPTHSPPPVATPLTYAEDVASRRHSPNFRLRFLCERQSAIFVRRPA